MAASHGSGPQSPPSIGRPVDRVFDDAQTTGEIILNGRKLRDFPKICNKYDLSDTVHVDFSRNRLADVPGEVCNYLYVERLNCYHNVIRSIPDAISQLQALTHLNLSRNQLTVLPPALCMLTSLEVLFASNNKLVSLPEEIGQLENLMDLDVSCNEISHLPLQIGDLSSLRSLNLRRNFLVELPVEISRLHLYKLDFSSNRIEKIPTVFRKMESLQLLIQANNPLSSPPAYICTKGKQHIMKYLHIEAIKEDRKRGIMVNNDFDLKRITRKSLPPQSSEELRGILGGPDKWKRHTVLSNDSGYSTGDGEKNGWHSGEIYPSNSEVNNNGRAWNSTGAPKSNINASDPNQASQYLHNHHQQPHYPASYIKPTQQHLPSTLSSSPAPSQQQQQPYNYQQQQYQSNQAQNNSNSNPIHSSKPSHSIPPSNQYPTTSQHYNKDNGIDHRNSVSMPSSSRRHQSNSSNSSSSTLSPGPSDLPPYPQSPSPSPSTTSSNNYSISRPDSLPNSKKPHLHHQLSSHAQFSSHSFSSVQGDNSASSNQHPHHPKPQSPSPHNNMPNTSTHSYLSPQLMPYPTSTNLAESGLYSPTSPTTPTSNSPGYESLHHHRYQQHIYHPNNINNPQQQKQHYYHDRQSSSSPLPPPPPPSSIHIRQWSNSSSISEQSLPPPPPPLSLPPHPSPSPSISSLRSNSPDHHLHKQHSRPPSTQSQSYKLQNAPFYSSGQNHLNMNTNQNIPPPVPKHQSYNDLHSNKYNTDPPPPPVPPHPSSSQPLVHQSTEQFSYIDDISDVSDGDSMFDSSPPRVMTGSMEDEFTRELKRQKADYERRKKEAEEIRAKQLQLDEEEREKEECRRAAFKLQEEQKRQEELRRQEDLRKQEELRIADERRKLEEEEARKREEEVRKLQEAVRLREAEEAMEKQRQVEEIQAREVEESRKNKLSNNNSRSSNRNNHPNQPPPNPPSSSSTSIYKSSTSSYHASSTTTTISSRSLPPKPPSSLPVHGVTSSLIPVSQRDSPQQDSNKEYIMSENEYRNALTTQSFKEQNRRLASTNSTQYRRAASDGLKKSTPSPASQVEALNHINKNGTSSSSDNNINTSSTSSSNSRLSSTSTTPSVSPSPSPSSSISYLARPTSHNNSSNNSPHSSTSHLAKPSSSSSSLNSTSNHNHHQSNLAKPTSSSSSSSLAKAGSTAANKSSAMPRASPSSTTANGQSQVVRRTKLAGDRSNTSSPTTARSTRTAQGSTGLRPTGGPNSLGPAGSSNIRRSSNSSTTDDERGSSNKSNAMTGTSLGTSRLKSSRLEEPKQRGLAGTTTGVRKIATPDNDNKRINTKPPTSTYGSNRTRTAATKNVDDGPNMRNKDDYHREEAEQMDRLRQTVEARLKVTLPDNLPEALRDGVVLCHLANQIRPRSVGSIHVPSPAVPKLTLAKCRRNVDNFLEACRKIGIGQEQICNAQDVLEERGISRVAITVGALVAIGTNPKQSVV